jgi:hypothetical protein
MVEQNKLSKDRAVEFYRKTEQSYHIDSSDKTIKKILNSKEKDKNGKTYTDRAMDTALKTYADDLQYALKARDSKGQEKNFDKWNNRIGYLTRQIAQVKGVGKNKGKQGMAIKNFALYKYQDAWRRETRDMLFEPYKPDNRTRQQITGKRTVKD